MFKHILIPIDLAHREQLARLIDASRLLIGDPGCVTLLYVDTILTHSAGSPQLDGSNFAEHERQARAQLQQLVESLKPNQVKVDFLTSAGVAHDQILEQADKIGADAIVMMAKKPGFTSYFIGSTAERVVRHAGCSVFVIRD